MTTLNELANRCNRALADQSEATWDDSTLEQWIVEAIRDYSLHFRMLASSTYDCVASQHNYELPADCLEVELVEYPKSQDPPKYLKPYSRKNADFWGAEGYYDVDYSGTADVSGTYTRGTLWISEDPVATEDIELLYWAQHNTAVTSDSELSVPPEHEHLLVCFVVWKAAVHLLMNEIQSPDTSRAMVDAYRRTANNMHDAYEATLRTAKTAADRAGTTATPWKSDDYDRVY